jgi:phage terminase large subunit-like protein
MSQSPAERFQDLPEEKRREFLESLSEAEAKALWYDWRDFHARPEQIAPEGDWDIWLAMAGRGFGKTRLGAEWVREQVYAGAQRIALVAETQKDLEEVMIEGDSGLLSVFPPDQRPEYKKKPVQLTFHTGAIALGYNATQPDQLRGPQFDTAWCFVAGTLVETDNGPQPIEAIHAGTRVLTRHGFKRVAATSSRDADVGEVIFSNGVKLVGTSDHPVWTERGWVHLGELTKGDVVCAINASNGAASAGIHTEHTTSAQTNHRSRKKPYGCIAQFGKMLTGLCRQGMKSIISTATSLTTTSPTWNARLNLSTCGTMRSAIPTSVATLQSFRYEILNALGAGRRLSGVLKLLHQNAVHVFQNQPKKKERQTDIVSAAVSDLKVGPETFAASVVSTWRPLGQQPVYCLTVAEQPEYFANGILVHNCDETAKWRYARETFDQLQFGLRLGSHPKQLHTTTPRPIPLIKEIVAGKEGKVVITRGNTMDNASNLAKPFLQKIRDRYEGTRLGRQELAGEILGDLPGALWSLDRIDLYRVKEQPENMERIVVSVDPAVTNTDESDEHGIIVAGISDKEGYVLEDGTLGGSPMDWARRAIALFDKHEADAIVIEVNQGGDMVAQTLRSVRSTLPIREVRASRGKHVRAEPIAALYEQGRVHHVGSFPELENQLTNFTNAGYEGEGSPDRGDALVWALSDLFPQIIKPDPKPKKAVHYQPTGWMG